MELLLLLAARLSFKVKETLNRAFSAIDAEFILHGLESALQTDSFIAPQNH